jgi:hypothetical protein
MLNGMATYSLDHPAFVKTLAKAGEDHKVVTLTVATEGADIKRTRQAAAAVDVFSPGQHVSALYFAEDKFYDAVIVSVSAARQSAVVEYIG